MPPKQLTASLQQTSHMGEAGNYRTKGTVSAPLQNTGLDIPIDLPVVVRGTYTPGGPPASLLVFSFHIDERFRKIILVIKFAYNDGDAKKTPKIQSLAPEQDFVMDVTKVSAKQTVSETETSEGAVALEVGEGWYSWSGKPKRNEIELYGGREVRKGADVAVWNLDTRIDGLKFPPVFQTAILLKHTGRDDTAGLKATIDFDIRADVDVAGKLTSQRLVTSVVINTEDYIRETSVIASGDLDPQNLSALGSNPTFLNKLRGLKVYTSTG